VTHCLHHQIPKTGTHSVVALMKDSFGEDAVSVIKQIEDRDRLGDVILVDGKQASTADIWNDLSKLKRSTKAMSVMAPWGFQKALALDYLGVRRHPGTYGQAKVLLEFLLNPARGRKTAFRSFQEVNYCLDRAAGRTHDQRQQACVAKAGGFRRGEACDSERVFICWIIREHE